MVEEEDVNSLVENMTTVSEEVQEVLNANQVIVDGITTLSGISQEISASTTAGKEDMEHLHDSVTSFSGAIDDTFEALERLKETAAIED